MNCFVVKSFNIEIFSNFVCCQMNLFRLKKNFDKYRHFNGFPRTGKWLCETLAFHKIGIRNNERLWEMRPIPMEEPLELVEVLELRAARVGLLAALAARSSRRRRRLPVVSYSQVDWNAIEQHTTNRH